MYESQKQMHTPLIPLANLLLTPGLPATELLEAVVTREVEGMHTDTTNKRHAQKVTCTYMRMGLACCLEVVTP